MPPTREPITAEQFFASRELNLFDGTGADPDPAETIWDALEREQRLLDDQVVDASSKVRSQTVPSGRLFFRGQSKQQHGLSSSLHRFLHDETGLPLTEQRLGAAELAIIADLKGRNLGRGMTPGELLMTLQHHGAPTRLMDVSERPLEALFFAVQGNDATDGRLFILNVAADRLEDELDLSIREETELPWTRYIRGATADSNWTQSVRLVKDRPLDPRMISQRGRFLVGGLARAYSNRNLFLEGVALNAAELLQVSMLTIGFRIRGNTTSDWPALGWTIRIPAQSKARLRELLDSRGINYSTMFPNLSDASWQGSEAGRNEIHTNSWRDRLRTPTTTV